MVPSAVTLSRNDASILSGKASGKKVLETIASFVNIFCLASVTCFPLSHIAFLIQRRPASLQPLEWLASASIQNLAPGDAVGVLGGDPLF